jgi:hypothetical protein
MVSMSDRKGSGGYDEAIRLAWQRYYAALRKAEVEYEKAKQLLAKRYEMQRGGSVDRDTKWVLNVDWENGGERWWEALDRELAKSKHRNDAEFKRLARWREDPSAGPIQVSDRVRRFLESLPGYNEGPPHAPHPVIFSRVDE